ncbi:hypothetical protein, partial [Bordetella pertussis]
GHRGATVRSRRTAWRNAQASRHRAASAPQSQKSHFRPFVRTALPMRRGGVGRRAPCSPVAALDARGAYMTEK